MQNFFFQTLACASSLLSDAEEPTSIGNSLSMKPRSESAVREAETQLSESGSLASPSLLFLFTFTNFFLPFALPYSFAGTVRCVPITVICAWLAKRPFV